MIDNFYMFSDLNRDSNLFPLETVYENWSKSSSQGSFLTGPFI